jgi:hypothetical protein
MVEAHIMFNVFMYAIVIAYILYINFATYYNSGTKFLNFLIKLFNNWVFRLIFLLIVGFFAMDLFPYGGFVFAILLTIAFLNTNMLVYKKEISEKFLGGSDAGIYGESNELEQENSSNEYVRNDGNMQEPYTPFVNRKGKRYRVINSNN